ncbi:modin [Phlyctema vagabunda]|uniref:Modin n=1 Tax=Phlyctema vagabunda TaxID=108571 RepID=A0ABR4PY68_9HELO
MGLTEVNLGLTALIVSLVALCTTVLQVLQQYFSSAEGYRRCAYSVMGLWSEGTHRQLRKLEFRFEVVFEAPVIFIAAPTNLRGPIPGRPIYYINGTEKSYTDTRTLLPREEKAAETEARNRVHTADDERASWVTLLSTLQQSERESREWDENKSREKPPQKCYPDRIYGISVGIQSKRRSWDFMPSSVTKPYANTTICHIVEMMAMLGMYWKSFDLSLWNLRAEGHGHILTSSQVQGLGMMVNFSVTGKSSFKADRVIPSDDIKKLCFGTVPDIFDAPDHITQQSKAQNIDLVFGTDSEVSDTLESLGCTPKMIKRYRKDRKHIFSVSFEIVAMLGKVVRIRGSNFRMLPNPTADHWLKTSDSRKASWQIVRLMEVFQESLKQRLEEENHGPGTQMRIAAESWKAIRKHGCTDDANLTLGAREAIHDAIDDVDKYLLGLEQKDVLDVVVAHLEEVMEVLENPTSQLNTIVLSNKEEPFVRFYFNEIFPKVINRRVREEDPPTTPKKKNQRSDIWVTLIFRMFCWLLLHDFDSKDTKIVPADLEGSRMPIYIG